jgi:hypothetical protein
MILQMLFLIEAFGTGAAQIQLNANNPAYFVAATPVYSA